MVPQQPLAPVNNHIQELLEMVADETDPWLLFLYVFAITLSDPSFQPTFVQQGPIPEALVSEGRSR